MQLEYLHQQHLKTEVIGYESDMIDLLIKSFWETCYMVFASTALST